MKGHFDQVPSMGKTCEICGKEHFVFPWETECYACRSKGHQKIEGIKRRYRRATAREDIPFLRAEITRLTAELEQAQKRADAYKEAQCRSEARLVEEMERARGLTAERDEKKAEIAGHCKAAYEHGQMCADFIMDRDRWKARAEALERAVKDPIVNASGRNETGYCAACGTCAHRGQDDYKFCGNRCSPGYRNWQFDEARFAGGKEGA